MDWELRDVLLEGEKLLRSNWVDLQRLVIAVVPEYALFDLFVNLQEVESRRVERKEAKFEESQWVDEINQQCYFSSGFQHQRRQDKAILHCNSMYLAIPTRSSDSNQVRRVDFSETSQFFIEKSPILPHAAHCSTFEPSRGYLEGYIIVDRTNGSDFFRPHSIFANNRFST